MERAVRRLAEEIMASLRLAGKEYPPVVREGSKYDKHPPALVIESAEAVTTFPGFDPDESRQWFDEADAAIAEAFPRPVKDPRD